MRTLPTLIAALFLSAAQAQPVLDATNTLLVPGPVYTINVSPIIDPGPAGADVVWDLSGLVVSAVATVTLVDPADEPLSADLFPQANLLTANDLSGQVKGYEATDDFIDSWGVFNNNNQLLLQQSNAVRELVLPCTMGTEWTDTDAGTFFLAGSSVGTRIGSTTGIADGYGELILPIGSFNNVLRVHLAQTVTDNTNFGSAVTTGDRYQYYLPGFPAPLAEIIDFTSNSGGSITVDRRVQWVNEVTTAVASDQQRGITVQAFPNPSADRTTILVDASGYLEVQVLDAMGRTVQVGRANASDRIELDLDGLVPGTYSVRVRGTDRVGTTRIIVQ